MDNLKVDAQTAKEAERSEKPLGRGLEEISRIFLTPKTENTPADALPPRPHERATAAAPAAATPAAAAPAAASAPKVVALRPSAGLTRAALASMIRELQDSLEAGLRVLDVSVPCYPAGEIDLLAVDRSNQLTIIDFDTTSSDALLLRGMAHYNWVLHNMPNMERMYSRQSINLVAEPRLLLLATSFSPLLTNAVRHLAKPRINWVRYHVVEAMPGSFGILFERVSEG